MHKLNDHDRVLLRLKQRNERDKQRYIKITTLLMLHDGYSPSQVAEALGIDSSTVHRYVQRFSEREDVEDYLRADYRGSRHALDAGDLAQLCDELNEKLYRSSTEVQWYIRETFGVRYSCRHVRRILKDLGFSFKKTTSVPAKADPIEQERFVREELLPLLERTRTYAYPLYFCDAVHPQYNTRPSFGWIAQGHHFCVRTTPGRHRANLTAAINVHQLSDVAWVQAQRIDAEATIALFTELEAAHPNGPIYVVCDNARYYQCTAVAAWLADHRIVIVYLPPYSPNLNVIERLWKYLRKTVLDTTYYDSFEAFNGAISSFFEHLDEHINKLRTLLTPNFHLHYELAN